MSINYNGLSEEIGEMLGRHDLLLTTAESCTGGWVAQVLTAVPGASDWYDRGFVTYSNRSKQEMLGVNEMTLQQFGAVSEETVHEMADGALRHSHAQISLAISGIAGPGGATLDKPVGTVCFAWAAIGLTTRTATVYFNGNREQIRHQAVGHALTGVLDVLADWR